MVARGPISARQLEIEEVRDRSSWGWNWSSVKTVLEWLFYCGEVTSVRRNSQFERVYDLPEQVLPTAVLAAPTPRPGGVGGRPGAPSGPRAGRGQRVLPPGLLPHPAGAGQAVAALVDSGELLPVTIQGWESKPHYVWRAALPAGSPPGRCSARSTR